MKAKSKVITTNEVEPSQFNSTVFSELLDKRIKLQEEKIKLAEQLKEGYTQKVFGQKLRFRDENARDYPSWDTHGLSEIINIYEEGNALTLAELKNSSINMEFGILTIAGKEFDSGFVNCLQLLVKEYNLENNWNDFFPKESENQVTDMNISIPTLAEQKKIKEFLFLLQNQVDLSKEKLQLLLRQKKLYSNLLSS